MQFNKVILLPEIYYEKLTTNYKIKTKAKVDTNIDGRIILRNEKYNHLWWLIYCQLDLGAQAFG